MKKKDIIVNKKQEGISADCPLVDSPYFIMNTFEQRAQLCSAAVLRVRVQY